MRYFCLVTLSLALLGNTLVAQKPGDKVSVAAASAELKHGSNVVGKVSKSDLLVVDQVNGDWLWVKTQIGNKEIKGWIHRNQVKPDIAQSSGQPIAQAKGAATLWIGKKEYKLNHLIAYKSKFYEDDPNLFTMVMATEKAVANSEIEKLKQSLAKNGTDDDFFLFVPNIKLTFDPDGGLMHFHGWADNKSLNGGSDVEAEITEKAGVVTGKAVMPEAAKFFEETYRFEMNFAVKLLGSNSTQPAGIASVSKKEMKNSRATSGIEIGTPQPREFSAKAIHLPIPPDARELEFDATFEDVEFISASPIDSLAAFYRVHMKARGWEEDTSEASTEDDEIDMTFIHGDSEVVVELARNSDGEIDVDLDCDELNWDGVHDPAGMAALGIPVSRSHLFLQKEVPRPETAYEIEYEDGELEFKSKLLPRAAASFYMKELQQRRFRQGRSRPFLTDNLCTLEFTQGDVTLDLKIFQNPKQGGSRITIEYENETPEPTGPSLAAFAKTDSSAGNQPTTDSPASSGSKPTAVDFSSTKGQATVTYGGRKYVFKNVVAHQSEMYADDRVIVQYSNRPIPFEKMQNLINTDDEFDFHKLYQYSSPQTFSLFLYKGGMSMSFSVNGVGIGGHRSDYGTHDAKVENGRIAGSFRMTKSDEILSKQFQFESTVDAPILRPSKWSKLESLELHDETLTDEHGPLLPNNAVEVVTSRSFYRRGATALVPMTLPQVLALYRKEMEKYDWVEDEEARVVSPDEFTVVFKQDELSAIVTLVRDDPNTHLMAAFRNDAQAKEDGLIPKKGKAHFVFGNASENEATVDFGKKSYTAKAGQGGKSPKDAINESIEPGEYDVTIKLPDEDPQTESITVKAGTAWGVIISPDGGYSVLQLY